ncbi:hypothetical protein SMACR_00937 [Sordaria macrospora]|uniref:Mitochondrial inner membrane protease subunit 2 n=2 Tax=Sordaria macrospora TaxID=5147 RepID=F7VNI3_SORMK|nr:uncharacterized protein SMAC_00937 [Sordaria macrospora k-hell]KAA8632725.1 hypothetical protein SMACR_00937 [Sordaria macrospora]KAH7630703.1 peptidase S24/S26A/S26B/S26C [Sordaria sp. MPI-SDFR-AT-0083]WPJ62180.1 hypothetical protein SMAC4_00937 [Sordaria macrospora]CCC06912.1 unnamed protein product [Sordaria macrospora k-hell]
MAARWGAGIRNGFLGQFSHYLIRYATWIPPLVVFNGWVAEITQINGPSMYPYFNPRYNESTRRDIVLVSKWYPDRHLKRGMIVTFRNPLNPKGKVVKRVVGIAGDVVRTKAPYPHEYVQVPEGHIWVEGDGDKTKDSNYYGPISACLVTGRVTHILSPWDRFGRVKWWEHNLRPGIKKARYVLE